MFAVRESHTLMILNCLGNYLTKNNYDLTILIDEILYTQMKGYLVQIVCFLVGFPLGVLNKIRSKSNRVGFSL